MKQLRIRTLAGLFVVAGVLAWAGARLWDSLGRLPQVPEAAPVVLAVIAVLLLATAFSLRGRLRAQRERRPGAKGVDPLMAARALVFGQAGALVAALVSGVYGGVGVFLLESLDIPPRRDQAIYAGFSVVAGLGVIAAALFLERVCKLPDDDEDDK
ncbi:DUF3180 domain-containing protein [Streptomyces sp. NPDC050560]|uniref:DUF3180 domain-containing protein n=1 Tax=Streptomyces sp. NPDC050560 TaxID=3365630 RepID=UPI0037A3F91C